MKRTAILLMGLFVLGGHAGQALASENCTNDTGCDSNTSCGTWQQAANGDDMALCVEGGWTNNDLICEVSGNKLEITGMPGGDCDKADRKILTYTARCSGTIKKCANDDDCDALECRLEEAKDFAVEAECRDGSIVTRFGGRLNADGSPAPATQLNAGSSGEAAVEPAADSLFQIKCLAGIATSGFPVTVQDIGGTTVTDGAASITCAGPQFGPVIGAVPTLGEWGMIVAGVGVLLAGVFLVVRRMF